MAPRLKVFITSDGLTDYVVAVSSRAKALAAWGVRQDVFGEGQAHETDDAALVKAAMAQPGVVLRKAVGGRAAPAPLRRPKPARPAGPTKAQLKKIAELEARLAALDAAHSRAIGKLKAKRAALDHEAARLAKVQTSERQRIETALKAAKRAARPA
jgi:hypothetical protein